jgi:hypothetical protein
MVHACQQVMRYLDLVQAGEPIEEAAMEKYAEMFQGLLALGAIAALRVTTRLANNQLSEVAVAMTEGELVAQVNASA